MLCLKFEHSPYKLGGSHCRFQRLKRKNSLNVTLNGRSLYNMRPETLIWGLFDHSPSQSHRSLSPFLFCRYLCLSHPVSLSCSEPNCTQSVRALCTTSGVATVGCCTTAQCRCVALFHYVNYFTTSDLRQGCHWKWTKKNWGETRMGTDLFRNWQDWVIDNVVVQ